MSVSRLENEGARMLRAVSASSAITFGCDAPYHLGMVGFQSIGFADIPCVGCVVNARQSDFETALVPVIRQHIMRAVETAGLETSALRLTLHWGAQSRKRMFTDSNPSSASEGKRKMGNVIRCHLEITDRNCVKSYRDNLPQNYDL